MSDYFELLEGLPLSEIFLHRAQTISSLDSFGKMDGEMGPYICENSYNIRSILFDRMKDIRKLLIIIVVKWLKNNCDSAIISQEQLIEICDFNRSFSHKWWFEHI